MTKGKGIALAETRGWQFAFQLEADEALASGKFSIPPLPQVAVELNDLANRRDPDLKAATQLVHRDPQLASRVLALASSAAFGSRVPISSLQVAVVRIGINGLRDIAFAVMMGDVFRCGALDFLMREENVRAYLLAATTHLVTRKLGLDSDQGFLAGLLADVGRIAILALLAHLGRSEPRWLAEEVPLMEILDATHTDVGPKVIAHWDLAPIVAKAARFHHTPMAAGEPLIIALAAADALVEASATEVEIEAVCQVDAIQQSGLREADLRQLLETVAMVRERSAALFG
ncbi:MAG: HDOD domain-containing protein [Deltaproteobacteria bacterium]|nr:HDOD domain-containing protein [Deltaproteobacteria bacterium]